MHTGQREASSPPPGQYLSCHTAQHAASLPTKPYTTGTKDHSHALKLADTVSSICFQCHRHAAIVYLFLLETSPSPVVDQAPLSGQGSQAVVSIVRSEQQPVL